MGDYVKELTSGEFDSFTCDGVVMIDFFAEWCMPCVMMSPIVDEMGEKFEGKIKIGKVNVSDEPGIAQKFGVSSIPNFTFMKDGEVVDKVIGAMSAEDLEEKLESLVQ